MKNGNKRGKRNLEKLELCKKLLEHLDPNHPPVRASRKEFGWQCRALRERIERYDELLSAAEDPVRAPNLPLHRAELAMDLSLRYFQDVLSPQEEADR